MAFCTQQISVTVTYTEPTGSYTGQWTYWVAAGTTAAMNAAADVCVNNQFASLKSLGTITIGAHTLGATRPNAPLTP